MVNPRTYTTPAALEGISIATRTERPCTCPYCRCQLATLLGTCSPCRNGEHLATVTA